MPRKPKVQLKKLPYANTKVSVAQSKADIDYLLRKAGVDGLQWGEIFKPKRMAEVTFARKGKIFKLTIPVQIDDLESQRNFIAPATFEDYVRKRERAMYRAMFYYLEGLMKAETHGLMTFEEAFTGHIEIRLPDGTRKTIKEAVNEISNLIALPGSKEG
jgi:hypothetical protein